MSRPNTGYKADIQGIAVTAAHELCTMYDLVRYDALGQQTILTNPIALDIVAEVVAEAIRPPLLAAEKLCEIYFMIAAKTIGEAAVRRHRNNMVMSGVEAACPAGKVQ